MRWLTLSAFIFLFACQTTSTTPLVIKETPAIDQWRTVDTQSAFYFPGDPKGVFNKKWKEMYAEFAIYQNAVLIAVHGLSSRRGATRRPTAEQLSGFLELSRHFDENSPVRIGKAFKDELELRHEDGHTFGRFWYDGGACLVAYRSFGTRLSPTKYSKATAAVQCFEDGRLPTRRVENLIGRLRSVDLKRPS